MNSTISIQQQPPLFPLAYRVIYSSYQQPWTTIKVVSIACVLLGLIAIGVKMLMNWGERICFFFSFPEKPYDSIAVINDPPSYSTVKTYQINPSNEFHILRSDGNIRLNIQHPSFDLPHRRDQYHVPFGEERPLPSYRDSISPYSRNTAPSRVAEEDRKHIPFGGGNVSAQSSFSYRNSTSSRMQREDRGPVREENIFIQSQPSQVAEKDRKHVPFGERK